MRTAEQYVQAGKNYYGSAYLSEEKKASLGTNVINELDINKHDAVGSVIVSNDGKIAMAIIINNRCYKKVADSNEISVSETTDTCSILTIPPDSCFDTTDNDDGTVTVSAYKCGNKSIAYNGTDYVTTYDDSGEYTSIQLPTAISGKKVTKIGTYAFCGNMLSDNQSFQYNRYEKNGDGKISEDEISKNILYGYGGAKKENVIVPSNVTGFNNFVFADTDVISVELPSSISSLPSMAFKNDSKLNSIKIDKENGSITGEPWGAPEGTIVTWR